MGGCAVAKDSVSPLRSKSKEGEEANDSSNTQLDKTKRAFRLARSRAGPGRQHWADGEKASDNRRAKVAFDWR